VLLGDADVEHPLGKNLAEAIAVMATILSSFFASAISASANTRV
jgi:hypothetical protein